MKTSIENKTNPRLPKCATQMRTPRELAKPAPRKRKPHRLVLQRSLAQSHHLQRPVNHGAGIEITMAHAVNGQSGRDVGGTEMRPAVDGFSGASRLCSSCKVCRMWLGKLLRLGFSGLSFYERTCIQHIYVHITHMKNHTKTNRPSTRMCL